MGGDFYVSENWNVKVANFLLKLCYFLTIRKCDFQTKLFIKFIVFLYILYWFYTTFTCGTTICFKYVEKFSINLIFARRSMHTHQDNMRIHEKDDIYNKIVSFKHPLLKNKIQL